MIERKALSDINGSVQKELELLSELRRPDLLEALPSQWLGGYARWLPDLLREPAANRCEPREGYGRSVHSVRS